MMEQQDRDYQWFCDHYVELSRKYGKSYLAIKNETVIGVYNDGVNGILETAKREELGTFIVQECTGTDEMPIVYCWSNWTK